MSYREAIKAAEDCGSFGEKKLDKIEIGEEIQKALQISSKIFFVKVVTGSVVRPLVVKTQPDHRRVSEESFPDFMFVNEVSFYSKLLPFLFKIDENVINLFPKYYYGYATFGKDSTKDTVILEDLSPMGFGTSDLGRELDVEHITLILKTLGKFHALSYKAKKEYPTEFRRLLSDLKNDAEAAEDFIAAALHTAPTCYQGFKSNMLKLRDSYCKNSLKSCQQSLIPKEPCAVLCHGDFCSNNILFLYNNNNKPVLLKLVDLQRCKYASPAIDLSFFLLYNTTTSTKIHWDFFLHIYYESLRTAYTDVVVPTFSEFMQDFITHITYGISTCSYFFRVISMSRQELHDYMQLENADKTKTLGTIGGEKAAKLINEMLQLIITKGYL